jgi:hypothetical protein
MEKPDATCRWTKSRATISPPVTGRHQHVCLNMPASRYSEAVTDEVEKDLGLPQQIVSIPGAHRPRTDGHRLEEPGPLGKLGCPCGQQLPETVGPWNPGA